MSLESPSILFVCYANICRSPTAEAVFREKVQLLGIDCQFDSAGTHGFKGKAPDKRSVDVATAKGYSFKGIKSRPVEAEDFDKFDYILAMDQANIDALKEKSDPSAHGRIKLLLEFAEPKIRNKVKEVPDPYYGGRKGFELVLELIENAADGLLEHIKQ